MDLSDILVQLTRIADALEAQAQVCGETKADARCALAAGHVGHHTTRDGRSLWLED